MPKPAPILPTTSAATLREQHNTSPAVADQIKIAQIDEAIQVRAETDQETVERYAELYRADKHALPPIIVYEDIDPETGAGRWYVADGNHRLAAAKLAKLKEIDALRRKGTRRDAQLFAISDANHSHGLRLTNTDKRRMVELLLADEEWRQWSDRELARRTHTSPSFVGGIRSTVHGAQTTTRKSKDGVTRQVAAIGKTPRTRGIMYVDPVDLLGETTKDPELFCGECFRSVEPSLVDRIYEHASGDVQRISECKPGKPAKINPIQIGSTIYVMVGASSRGGRKGWADVELVPIITTGEAAEARFRQDVIIRNDSEENLGDSLGKPVTWKGAPDGMVLSTRCDVLHLADVNHVIERIEAREDDEPNETATDDEPETLSPESVATGAPDEDVWPHPDEESDDEQDGPEVRDDGSAVGSVPEKSWKRAEEPAAPAPRKTKTQARDQLIADQLAELLEAGKVGRLSIHQVAALAAVTGCEDNTELTYNDQLVSNACYELSKTVGAEIAHHLRHQTSKLKQLPKLPQLCALFGADYDTFAAQASAAVEG